MCPTGIDIRNGIQLECVNCTACIDACDDVMQRLERPPGLIRLTSAAAVQRRAATPWLTPRVKAYAIVWLVLVGWSPTAGRRGRPLDVLVLRQPGTLLRDLPGGDVANFYNVQALNRTSQPAVYRVTVLEPTELPSRRWARSAASRPTRSPTGAS